MGEKDTTEVVKQDYTISGLYYNYRKRDDDEIKNYLKKIQIVKLTNKGEGTLQGYYPLSDKALEVIMEAPRGRSLTFDATEIDDKPILGLRKFKEIIFLVKSSSRFFFKPDIGEIIDQLSFNDFHSSHIKAILFMPNEYDGLPDTGGEHFIMKATLLVDENTITSKTLHSGWVCNAIN